jgi:hypothetical protein
MVCDRIIWRQVSVSIHTKGSDIRLINFEPTEQLLDAGVSPKCAGNSIASLVNNRHQTDPRKPSHINN